MTSILTPQQEELVAVGAAVAANCTPCLRSHFGKALEAGATLDQIKAAVAVGQAVKQAPIRHVNEAWQELTGSGVPPTNASCCS
jgi:AhpD family alkylhydroperoxidase